MLLFFCDEKSKLMSLSDWCNVCNVVLIFNIVMIEPTGSFDGSDGPLCQNLLLLPLPDLQHLLLYPQVCTGNNDHVYILYLQ